MVFSLLIINIDLHYGDGTASIEDWGGLPQAKDYEIIDNMIAEGSQKSQVGFIFDFNASN
jgi:acetoin utilization deacetylase AcuC-like enzyme